jgi:phosphate uptake regulator
MKQNKEQELLHVQLMLKHGYEALETYEDFKSQKILIDEDRVAKLISLDLSQIGEQCGYI